MPQLVYDVKDKSYELVSPIDLDSVDGDNYHDHGDCSPSSSGGPVEAYDLLSLLVSPTNEEMEAPVVIDDKHERDRQACIRHDRKLPVGTRIWVWWTNSREWYSGRIEEHTGSATHVLYDDGDEQWLRLEDEKYQVVRSYKKAKKSTGIAGRVKNNKRRIPRRLKAS
jgi:hypothetical protein